MAAATSIPISHAAARKWRLAPTLPDLLFACLLVAGFGRPDSWLGLLRDGDTGWHIRTGEYILDHGVPFHDLFSFSRAGQRWFAWEWLSELIFARVHRGWGLTGVAIVGAVLVCLPAALLFARMLRGGVGAWVALPLTLAASSAASIHALVRPHLFSLVLMVVGLWMVAEDRRGPTPWLWVLVPAAGVWANLHGGFAAWLATLAWLTIASAIEGSRASMRRYALLGALSVLATLINPYGWQLHRHIVDYLGSSWIADHVAEFQSPQIRSENMLVFAFLLLAGVAAAAKVWRRNRFEAGLVVVWGFAAMRSARYVPLFGVVAAPLIASCVADGWRSIAGRGNARSPWRMLWESSQALGSQWRLTAWMPILGALAIAAVLPPAGLADFPWHDFPVTAVNQNSEILTRADARILTSDQWGDYLIYRLYPRTRVFFDGRSDFYGAAVGDDYRVLLQAGRKSREVMGRYGFTAALLPLDWPLGQILECDREWRVVYRDGQAVLLVRSGR